MRFKNARPLHPEWVEFGQKIRDMRYSKRISDKELIAEIAAIGGKYSRSRISDYELGNRAIPLKFIIHLAQIGWDVSKLFEGLKVERIPVEESINITNNKEMKMKLRQITTDYTVVKRIFISLIHQNHDYDGHGGRVWLTPELEIIETTTGNSIENCWLLGPHSGNDYDGGLSVERWEEGYTMDSGETFHATKSEAILAFVEEEILPDETIDDILNIEIEIEISH